MSYDCGHSGYVVQGCGVGSRAAIARCCTKGCGWFLWEYVGSTHASCPDQPPVEFDDDERFS